jgi:hypothetical protein
MTSVGREGVCPHGMPLAENVCGPCSKGRPNALKLSPTMQRCVEYIRQHGAIHRHPGGFWAHAEWQQHSGPWHDTGTIQALVRRGVAEYSEWQQGRSGRFPIKAILLASPANPGPTPVVGESAAQGAVASCRTTSLSDRS